MKMIFFQDHDEAIDEFGGGHGIRDKGLILSALNRPKNLILYNPDADAADLAAAYAHGIVKNHGFMDGNKRSGLAATLVFLEINGYSLNASAQEMFDMFLEIANNTKSQEELANWFRSRL